MLGKVQKHPLDLSAFLVNCCFGAFGALDSWVLEAVFQGLLLKGHPLNPKPPGPKPPINAASSRTTSDRTCYHH